MATSPGRRIRRGGSVSRRRRRYQDVFQVTLPEGDARSAEELMRAGLEGAPGVVRRVVPFVHRRILLLRLGSTTDPDRVLGWRVDRSTHEVVVLRADSPLADARLEGRRTGTGVLLTTTLEYRHARLARAVWTVVGPLHRRVAPLLLARAAQAGSVAAAGTRHDRRRCVELPQGPLEYVDSGGTGPVVVLVNAALADEALWAGVIDRLEPRHRCVAVVLPLGAHRRPMHAGTDLSLSGQARLLADFLEALDLRDVTLCFNDWCGAQLMVAKGWTERVARLVLVSCETAGNYPPGLPGRFLALLARLPGGLWLGYQSMRLPLAHRLPFTLGRMTRSPIPPDLAARWFDSGRRIPEIRRDLRAYVRDVPASRRALRDATRRLGTFSRPVLVVWGAEDHVMPRSEGKALAAAFPHAAFRTVESSGTLVPLDQPGRLATLIDDFVGVRVPADTVS